MIKSYAQTEELLVLLSLVKHTAEEHAHIKEIAKTQIDWDEFAHLCEVNQTSALIYYRLSEFELIPLIPAHAYDIIKKKALKIKQDNQNRLKTGIPLIKAMADAGIKVVILKGMNFAETIYSNSFYKKMNDIDILIPKEHARIALKVFAEQNFFSAGELLGEDAESQLDYSHHFPPFFSRDLNCMVGTHWGLINPLIGITPDYESMWQRVRPFNFHGVECFSLSPTDNLHHLCIHLSPHKCGIKEVGDIYNLIRFYGDEVDYHLLLDEARKANSVDCVWMGLKMAQGYFYNRKLQNIISSIENEVPASLKKDVSAKTRSRSFLIRARTAYLSNIDKAYTRFKSTQKPHEKLKAYGQIWKHLLFPPVEDALKLTHLDGSEHLAALRARIFGPSRIVQAFCHDLGTKIFFLLLLHTTYSTGKSFVRSALGKSKKGMAEYAAELGLTIEELEELRERLE